MKALKNKLSLQLLIAMVLGVAVGLLFKEKVTVISFVGSIYLRLLKMCVYPMVLLGIVVAVAKVIDIRYLKKVGGMFIAYTLISSSMAALWGVVSMHIFKPGASLNWVADAAASEGASSAGETLIGNLVGWIPENPIAALAEGNLIQIVIFALIFGVVVANLRKNDLKVQGVLDLLEGTNTVFTQIMQGILKVSPIAIFAMTANTVGTFGAQMIESVAQFMAAYWVAIIVHSVILIFVTIKLCCKLSIVQYIKNVFPVIVMALSTLSSVGTLPVTITSTKKRCGVDDGIVDLLAAPAATINMDGAAAEFAGYIIFASYIYGVELSIPQLILTIGLALVMSIGSAGIPGGGIIMSTLALSVMGLPQDILPIIAGVYTVLDLGATVVNIIGDTTGMVFIGKKTGGFNAEVFNAKNG